MDVCDVLGGPFDAATHKRVFTNYLEVIIRDDGTIEYATPSHQEKLISILMDKNSLTRDELNASCPRKFWCDFMTWLTMESGCIAVWNNSIQGVPNQEQQDALFYLKKVGLYTGK